MSYRKITNGERGILSSIFKSSINYDLVKVHSTKHNIFQSDFTSMAPDGNLYMAKNVYVDDYSHPSVGIQERAHFIHEMAHVWQFTNKILRPIRKAMCMNKHIEYRYDLAKGDDLLGFYMEMQAEIISDYFLLKNYGLTSNMNIGTKNSLRDYEDVLKNFLQDPSYGLNRYMKASSSEKRNILYGCK
jgi:hypothetical protein